MSKARPSIPLRHNSGIETRPTPKQKVTLLNSKSSIASKNGALLFYLLTAVSSMAQSDKPPIPQEPLLPKAPEMAAWTITFQYPSNDSRGEGKKSTAPKGRVVSIEIEKTQETYHKITHYDKGIQSEAWSINGRELIKQDVSSSFVPTSPNGPIADDHSKSDFEDLDWLSMKCYVGPGNYEHPGFVFRAKYKDRKHTRREKMIDALRQLSGSAKAPSTQVDTSDQSGDFAPISDQKPDSENTVTLDAKTQLPAEYDQGAVKWSYRFLSPPETPLVPPQEVIGVLKQWDTTLKASESNASPP